MKISSEKQIDTIKYNGLLLYGNDIGLINKVRSTLSSLQTIEITIKDFEIDLFTLMSSQNMLFSRTLFLIRTNASITKQSQELLAERIYDNFVLFLAEEVNLSLRKFCEGSDKMLSLGCYPENTMYKFEQEIRELLPNIDSDALKVISETFLGDRTLLYTEIEKIKSFCSNKITKKDVELVLSQNIKVFLDDAAFAFAKLDPKYFELIQEFQDVQVLRAILRLFINLYKTHEIIASGKTFDFATKELGIFFKNLSSFKLMYSRFSFQEILEVIYLLHKAEIESKKGNKILEHLFFQFKILKGGYEMQHTK